MGEEQKWEEFRRLVQEMREAMTVDFAMKRRHEDRIKEHEEWLRQNELAAARHREFTQKHEEFIRQHEAMMVSLQENLDRLEKLIIRGQSTNGNQT